MFGIGENEEDERDKKWKTILQGYNYQLTGELDLVLAEAVKTGFILEEQFRNKANNKNQEILAAKSEGSFSDAWRLYHDSFDDNTEEVVNGLYESFKKNYKYITPLNLNGTVSLFRELGENDKATEIIDLYIEKRKDETELFNLKENSVFGDIKDAEVIEKFNKAYSETITIESPKDVLNRIAGKNSWNQSDEVILVNATVDEYYELFKSEQGRHLSSFINTCLTIGQSGNASDQQKEITRITTEALKRIGSESEINKRRVKKFGIDV